MRISEIIRELNDIECSDKLSERLADWFGIYGSPDGDHEEDCECRICFTMAVKDCIEKIHENEQDEKILKLIKEQYKNGKD